MYTFLTYKILLKAFRKSIAINIKTFLKNMLYFLKYYVFIVLIKNVFLKIQNFSIKSSLKLKATTLL